MSYGAATQQAQASRLGARRDADARAAEVGRFLEKSHHRHMYRILYAFTKMSLLASSSDYQQSITSF